MAAFEMSPLLLNFKQRIFLYDMLCSSSKETQQPQSRAFNLQFKRRHARAIQQLLQFIFLYANQPKTSKSTSSPSYISIKGHNPYHTRPLVYYIKGKILWSIYAISSKIELCGNYLPFLSSHCMTTWCAAAQHTTEMNT